MAEKVMVAMSGGVDSTVTAHLIQQAGYDACGATLFLYSGNDGVCGSQSEIALAKTVAEALNMKHYTFDFQEDFKNCVIDNFIDAYVNGSTPNPCIECNRHIKFDKLIKKANELGYDYIATGHYAIVEKDSSSDRFLLKKGADSRKDQSYVLYTLTQHQLSKTLFPLGNLEKSRVREIALENNFINAKKHDSQDICFVPDNDYASFIENCLNKTFPPGNFEDLNGNVLGQHKGIIRYTIGQRRGLGLALASPMYVHKKDIEKNTVVLCDNDSLFSKSLDAKDINLIPFDRINGSMRLKAKVRYKQSEQWATVTQTDDNHIHVEFDQAQRAISKGQSVVLYDGDIVVGGGTIM